MADRPEVQQRMKERGLSSRPAAKEIGIGFSSLCRWLRGEDANASTMRLIDAWMAGSSRQQVLNILSTIKTSELIAELARRHPVIAVEVPNG